MLTLFSRFSFWCVLGLSFLLPISLEAKNKKQDFKRQDFIVFTPPKCGTHLIGKALQLMLNEEPLYCLNELGSLELELQLIKSAKEQNRFVVAHNFSPALIKILAKKGYKIIFILRDPRDQLISLMRFMQKGNWPEYPVAHIADQTDQIDELITGTQFHFRAYEGCIKGRLERILPLPTRIVHVTRFEYLVGAKGGGSRELQQKELLRIARFIKYKITPDEAKKIGEDMFGGTWTFNEGQIGKWREYFLPYQKEVYKLLYGETLKQLGYKES